MSKAFTRESDESPELTVIRLSSVPRGVRNYMTPQGTQRLRRELEQFESNNFSSMASAHQ